LSLGVLASVLGDVVAWQISEGRLASLVVFSTSSGEPAPMGLLERRGNSSSFLYARSWIGRKNAYSLWRPTMPLRTGEIQSTPFAIPLPLYDSAPDGWGRAILEMAFPEQQFGMMEFLAAAGEARSGELAIGPNSSGPQRWAPSEPMLRLPQAADTLEELMEAAAAVEAGAAKDEHIRLLLAGSVGVGGARPKAALLANGKHVLAKFSAQGDPFSVPRIEAACLSLAEACGINTPAHELVELAGRPALLVDRFDRTVDGRRIGYASAGTLTGEAPSTYATSVSYADIAAKARAVGVEPCEEALFARLLFNCFVGNTDDHLRNHGFLRLGRERWKISPIFDIEPRRKSRLILAPARGISPAPNPVTAFAAHRAMHIPLQRAREIYEHLVEGLRVLPTLFERYGVGSRDRATMEFVMKPALNPPALAA
jgi:serine/threonine-protein kinase HipA